MTSSGSNGRLRQERGVTSEITFASKWASHVIGKAGWRVNKIKNDTRTRISLQEEQNSVTRCLIKGNTTLDVETASEEIAKIVKDLEEDKRFKKNKRFAGKTQDLSLATGNTTDKDLEENKRFKKNKRFEGKTQDVSFMTILHKGEPPVSIRAVWKDGKLSCPKCPMTFGPLQLRTRLMHHAMNGCYEDASDKGLTPSKKPVGGSGAVDGLVCERCWRQFSNERTLVAHISNRKCKDVQLKDKLDAVDKDDCESGTLQRACHNRPLREVM